MSVETSLPYDLLTTVTPSSSPTYHLPTPFNYTTLGASGPITSAPGSHNPDDPEWLKTFALLTDGVATNIIVVAGLIANALTLAVLRRPTMRTSTNSFLSALAVWDSVVLTCSAAIISLPGLTGTLAEKYRTNGPMAYAVSYIYPVGLVAQTATIWLTVSFAVERYIGVHYPLRAATVCTVQRARYSLLFLAASSFIYHSTPAI